MYVHSKLVSTDLCVVVSIVICNYIIEIVVDDQGRGRERLRAGYSCRQKSSEELLYSVLSFFSSSH